MLRVGTERAAELAKGKVKIFEPMPGRAWKDYVQVEAGSLPKGKLSAWAEEALEWTGKLPGKKAKGKPALAKAKKKVAAKR